MISFMTICTVITSQKMFFAKGVKRKISSHRVFVAYLFLLRKKLCDFVLILIFYDFLVIFAIACLHNLINDICALKYTQNRKSTLF